MFVVVNNVEEVKCSLCKECSAVHTLPLQVFSEDHKKTTVLAWGATGMALFCDFTEIRWSHIFARKKEKKTNKQTKKTMLRVETTPDALRGP